MHAYMEGEKTGNVKLGKMAKIEVWNRKGYVVENLEAIYAEKFR